MKEALTILMLAMLIVPLLVGVRRLRRVLRASDRDSSPPSQGGD